MDLHLGAAVPELPAALGDRRRRLTFEQAPVELRRRHVRDHGAAGRDGFAAGEPDADRLAVAYENALDVPARFANPPVVADQLHERIGQPRAAAARDRHPALLNRHGDHLRHEPRQRRVWPEPRVQHPRREQPVRALGGEGGRKPVAARRQRVPRELCKPAATEPAVGLHPEREPVLRPELGPEDAEGQIGIREEAVEHLPPGVAVACGVPVELLRVRVRAPEQEGRLAVGIERRRRVVGVQVLEPTRRELVPELRVRRAADPERMPGAERVVEEAGPGQRLGLDRAAEPVVALEDDDAPVRAGEERRARQRVDPAADEDRVVVSHPGQAAGTRRP